MANAHNDKIHNDNTIVHNTTQTFRLQEIIQHRKSITPLSKNQLIQNLLTTHKHQLYEDIANHSKALIASKLKIHPNELKTILSVLQLFPNIESN